MNWFGQLPAGGEGFEYHLIVIGLAATVVLQGSGAMSIDRLIAAESASMPASRTLTA
jgi:putative oxidoreductase